MLDAPDQLSSCRLELLLFFFNLSFFLLVAGEAAE